MASVVLRIANFTPFPLAYNQYSGGGTQVSPIPVIIPVGQGVTYQVVSGLVTNPSGWFQFTASTGDQLYIGISNPLFGTNKLGIGQSSGSDVTDNMTNNNYQIFTPTIMIGGVSWTATCLCTPGDINNASVVIASLNVSSYTAAQQIPAAASLLYADLFLTVESGDVIPSTLQSGQAIGYYQPSFEPPQNAGTLAALCRFGGKPYAITNFHFMRMQPLVVPPGNSGTSIGTPAFSNLNNDYIVYGIQTSIPLQAGVAGIVGSIHWPLVTPTAGMTLRGVGRKSGQLSFTIVAGVDTGILMISLNNESVTPQPGDSGTLLLDNGNNAVAFFFGYSALLDFAFTAFYNPGSFFGTVPTNYMAVSLPFIIGREISPALGAFTPIT